jgi:hypothetical protein
VYRFYEWGGLIKRAYSGKSDKFGINADQLDQYVAGGFDRYFSAYFNAEGHQRICGDMLRVIIEGSMFTPTFHTVPVPAPSQCASPISSNGKGSPIGR